MKPIVANSKKSSDVQKSQKDKAEATRFINVESAFGSEISKLKSISFKVFLKCTNEQFSVKKFPVSMKVRELKSLLEFVCGIPYNLQRLSYLDDGIVLS